jgi:hypothetical protein
MLHNLILTYISLSINSFTRLKKIWLSENFYGFSKKKKKSIIIFCFIFFFITIPTKITINTINHKLKFKVIF